MENEPSRKRMAINRLLGRVVMSRDLARLDRLLAKWPEWRSLLGAYVSSAAFNGDLSLIDELLNRGADIDDRNESGETTLTYMIVYNHPDAVKHMVERGANLKNVDVNGCSPLDWASRYSSRSLYDWLAAKGAKHVKGPQKRESGEDGWGGS